MIKTEVKASVECVGVIPRMINLVMVERSAEGRTRRYTLRIEDGVHCVEIPLPKAHKPKLLNLFRALRRVIGARPDRTMNDEDFTLLWTNLLGTKAVAWLLSPEGVSNLLGPWATGIVRPRYKLRVGGADNTVSYICVCDVLISALMQVYHEPSE